MIDSQTRHVCVCNHFVPDGNVYILTRKRSGRRKRAVPKRTVLADVPLCENRNEGTFGCSPVPETGTRVHSDVPLY